MADQHRKEVNPGKPCDDGKCLPVSPVAPYEAAFVATLLVSEFLKLVGTSSSFLMLQTTLLGGGRAAGVLLPLEGRVRVSSEQFGFKDVLRKAWIPKGTSFFPLQSTLPPLCTVPV